MDLLSNSRKKLKMICPSKLPLRLMGRSHLIGQALDSFVQFHASRDWKWLLTQRSLHT